VTLRSFALHVLVALFTAAVVLGGFLGYHILWGRLS